MAESIPFFTPKRSKVRSVLQAVVLVFLAASSTQAAAQSTPSFGSGGLRAQGVPGAVARDGTLGAALVVTNTSSTAARIFLSEYPTATDNQGHSWIANIHNNTVSGIYICGMQNRCLTEYRQQTEQSATILDPGQSLTIPIRLHINDTLKPDEQFGDLYSIGFLVGGQAVREEVTGTGSVIVGGAWRTISLGVVNIPLRGPAK